MKRTFWTLIMLLWPALAVRAIPLEESLNNVPTASTFTAADSFLVIQGGIGKKASNALVTGVLQPFDADLQSLANASSTGMYYRSAANTWSPVTIGTGLTFIGGTLSATATGGGGGGTWGSITGTLSDQIDLQSALDARQPLDGDLSALAAITTNGSWYYRSATNVWSPVVIGSGLSFSGGTLTAIDTGGVWGSITGTLSAQADLQAALNSKQAADADLTSLAATSSIGALYYRSAADTWSPVTIGSTLSFTGGTLGVGTVPGTSVSFSDSGNHWTATNVDAALAELADVNVLGPNTAASKVDWSQLKNMPAGFADGSDDGASGGSGTLSVIKEDGVTVGTTMTTLDFLGADFDITESPAGEANINVAGDAITFAKMQNIATGVLLGRSTAAAGDIETINVGTGLSLSGGTLSATGSGSSVAWGSITGTLSAQTDLQAALDAKQPLDGDLTNFAAISATGSFYYHSAANTWSPVTIGSSLTFTGGTLNVGDLSGTYQPLDADLLSLAGASNTNSIYYRSATNTWSPVVVGAGLTFSGGTLNATSSGVPWGAITGTLSAQTDLQAALDAKQPLDADLTSLAGISAAGSFYYRSATNTWSPVTIGSGLTFASGTLASTGGASWGAISGTLSSQNDLQTALDGKQPLDSDLTALAGISATGNFYYRSAANVWSPVTIGSGLAFGSGTLSAAPTWGSITGTLSAQSDLQAVLDAKQPLDADLTSLAGISATGSFYYRSAANTWAPVTVGSGLAFSSGSLTATAPAWGSITGTLSSQSDLQSALNTKQPLDADLTSLAAAAGTNTIYYRSAADTFSPVTVGSGLTFTGGTLSAAAATFDIDGLTSTTAAALDGDDVFAVSVDGAESKITTAQMEAWIESLSLTFASMSATNLSASSLEFEGATADAFETMLGVVDPTQDNFPLLPNASDTLVGKATTDVFTNKTLDANATGNILKFKALPQFTSPGIVDGTGCTIGTTATVVGYGLANYSATADEAANYAEYRFVVPADWDTTVNPRITRIVDKLGGNDNATRQYVASVASVGISESVVTTPATPIDVNISADTGGVSNDVGMAGPTTLTGWGAAVVPGEMMTIRVARDGDDATNDASTTASTLVAFELEYAARQPYTVSAPTPPVSLLWDEGFEGAGLPSGWHPASSGDFDSTTSPLAGAQSLRTDPGEINLYTLTADQGTLYFKCLFRVTALPAAFWHLITMINTGGVEIWVVDVTSTGALVVSGSGINAGAGATTVATVSANTTYYLWGYYKKGTGANSEARIWFNTVDSKPADGSNNSAGATDGTAVTDVDGMWIKMDGSAAPGALDVDTFQGAISPF